ncbi:MAG TPA: helix-turn-helix domain-containing protein [Algoriphagus sp.]|nr:helix-turn-helix domain-containing protein [Algoriphagus sp.]
MELSSTLTILLLSLAGITLIGLGYYFFVIIPAPELIDSEIDPEISLEVSMVKAREKYDDVLDQFDEQELTQKIYQLLVLEKIYLQQGLTVGEFAKKLGVQARIVTQIFDKLYGHTFKELTNMYRVEYAKERIEEGYLDLYTLEALGHEAGFSSRTTFFNVFKKEIGTCPSEYWKSSLENVA